MEKEQTEYKKGTVYEIPIKDIKPDPKQPRKYFDKERLDELKESIKTKGVIQPIIFRQDEKKKLFIVAGERRYKAATSLKLETIPGILTDGDPAEISLIENLQRENLTAVEEAEGYKRLKDEKNCTDEVIASIVGKAQSTISDMLLICNLPDEIKDECRENPSYSRRELIKVARHKFNKGMISAFRKYQKKMEQRESERQKSKHKDKETVTISAIDTILARLDKVNSEWKKEEKAKIRTNLESLQTKIADILMQLQ